MVSAAITTAFAQENAEAAHHHGRSVVDPMRATAPKRAALMDETEYDVLAFMDFQASRLRIHTISVTTDAETLFAISTQAARPGFNETWRSGTLPLIWSANGTAAASTTSETRSAAELRDEVHRARHESLVDALTGLANRRAFDQRLAACLAGGMAGADGTARPCLVVTDIDHFKRVNDKYGHGFGDQVLKAVAQVLRAFTPESGVAARIGGEEFALLLPDTAVDAARAIAEQVRTTIGSSRVRRGPDELIEHITVSLGVVPCRSGESPREFLDRADAALYASKQAGRDRVTVVRD
jgi:diguanylate cyclase (GGDEF)-like protein